MKQPYFVLALLLCLPPLVTSNMFEVLGEGGHEDMNARSIASPGADAETKNALIMNGLKRKRKTTTPTHPPTKTPLTPRPTGNPACVTFSTYNAIDADIAKIKDSFVNIKDLEDRGHFLGGVVRLVAHDFMDFDQTNATFPMGADGCFDPDHSVNTGLNTIWCTNCTLKLLHEQKYSNISKADFWVAAANAVIRQTSVDNALDMKKTFLWGRKDAASCPSAGTRIPRPTNCTTVEDVFVTKMGLSWKDAVALMGAHTLGQGNEEFSGHEGLWKDTEEEAQIFDKKYYDEMLTNSWRPRAPFPRQDWTTGPGNTTRMMLTTDLCLVFDIGSTTLCCTGDACEETTTALSKCPVLSANHARYETLETVEEMLSGVEPYANAPFYKAFEESWNKATVLGQSNLSPLKRFCR